MRQARFRLLAFFSVTSIACVAALAGVFWNHRQPKERPPVADTANSRHADSTEYSLTEADRKYIWDIEHVAFQLNQKVAPVFCGAIERADRAELLQFLADDYRGQVFAAEDTAGLVEALTKRVITREDRAENRLWQWWVTLVLVLSLLTVEWVGRKLAGLP